MAGLERCSGCEKYAAYAREKENNPNAQPPCDNCPLQKAAVQADARKDAGRSTGGSFFGGHRGR